MTKVSEPNASRSPIRKVSHFPNKTPTPFLQFEETLQYSEKMYEQIFLYKAHNLVNYRPIIWSNISQQFGKIREHGINGDLGFAMSCKDI